MKKHSCSFVGIPESEINILNSETTVMPACFWPVSIAKSGAALNFLSRLISRFGLNILFILLPTRLFAAEEKTSTIINTDPMSGSYLFQLILGLIVVLVCIVGLAWFARRMNRLQSSTGSMLKIIGGLSMGSRERIVLLQVGSEQLLIGVSPGRINKLHVMETPLEDKDVNSEKTFAHSLSEKLSTVLAENK